MDGDREVAKHRPAHLSGGSEAEARAAVAASRGNRATGDALGTTSREAHLADMCANAMSFHSRSYSYDLLLQIQSANVH